MAYGIVFDHIKIKLPFASFTELLAKIMANAKGAVLRKTNGR